MKMIIIIIATPRVIIMRRLIYCFNSPPPPLHLHEYSDRASEGGKFEPCLSRAGNLNQKCQVFTAEVF